MMRITDSHAHIFPSAIASAAVEATSRFYADAKTPPGIRRGTPVNHAGTVDDLLKREQEAGIDRALVFSCATKVSQVMSVNTFTAGVCAEHPSLVGAGTMFIGFPDYEGECDRLLSLGLKGIKLHPDIQRFAVDDERLFPLYEIMQAKGLFLISHAGDYRFDFSGPLRLRHVALMFPGLKLICAHFGGWSEWGDAGEYLQKLDNVYFDTSSTIPFAGKDPALAAFRRFDRTHIFFGTDYPMWDPKKELDTILSLGLDDATLEGVLRTNFDTFLSSL